MKHDIFYEYQDDTHTNRLDNLICWSLVLGVFGAWTFLCVAAGMWLATP